MLEARSLTKKYGSFTALDRLDLTIQPGEVFCLLGSNGAGKSTTINLFLNFIDASEGSALIDGIDVAKHPLASKQKLAYIPEQVSLYGHLTGLENLAYLAGLGSAGKDYSRSDLKSFLLQAGLQDSAHRRPVKTYSKGMRQKVGIALAIARQASTVLLDEPTSGLDPQASNEFSNLLLEMKSRGVSILMATHDLFRAKETGTRLGIIKADEIGHSDLEKLYLEHMHD
jgi:ABC-2 type transport system ATP-binding protein